MNILNRLLAVSLTSILMACAGTSEQRKETFGKDNDPRVGKEVRQVCHTRSISGWSDVDNDRNALLVHMGNKTTYKVSLVGACDPDWAMMGIAVITRGATGCMATGDKIVTDAQPERRAACSITRIYKWHEDAADSAQPEKP